MNLKQKDRDLIWHPFTQQKTSPPPILMQKGKGAYLYDDSGKSYLDLVSSWWVNLHGHAHPHIAQAIFNQAQQLEHVIFAGYTHEPAIRLCSALKDLLNPSSPLQKFFFSDNGSTAVEVALKMSYQYWRNLGHCDKRFFISFCGGYHGDTFGAMSVGAQSHFHQPFKELFFPTLSINFPETWIEDTEIEKKEQDALSALKDILFTYKNKISAIILEPLLQGASGMRLCRPEFLNAALSLIKEENIFIIFDEIFTGFYRTGTFFAFEQLKIAPDFLCLSKGLTGGFLPLALTLTRNDVYDAFLAEESNKAFLHGHSYTANPIACSAALASLELLTSESCTRSIADISAHHKEFCQELKKYPEKVEKPRFLGTMAAFNLKADADSILSMQQKLLQKGLLLRPLGNSFYILPPYCITSQEMLSTYQSIEEQISQL